MNEIRITIKSFLEKYDLNNPNSVFLVGFSGGYDSMCLLDNLKKLAPKNKIIALHLNHKWREGECDIEENNCKRFCKSINVDFYSETLSQNIPHTETAAREARYEFFEKCANKFNSNIVFTAHNKNDNVETLIYRICMGTGISGLQGIKEKRGIFYRPLLNITRDEIEKYCTKNKLTPNVDSSNSNTKYKRNNIRANIIPAILEINANATEAITTLSQNATEETEIVEEFLEKTIKKITENNKIKTKKFLNLSPACQNKIIYKLFTTKNLDYDRKKILKIKDFILENSNSKSGKTCSLTENLWIFASCEDIEIITKEKQQLPYFHITKTGKYVSNGYVFEIEKFNKPVKKFPKDCENTAYVNIPFDIDFELRQRQDGDIIQPFGMKGTQKLKKYLNEKKIPNHEKDNLLFLARNNEIFWAINLGISDKIKVTTKPTHIMKFYKEKRQTDGN